jgi:hypothetical protein
MIFIPSTLAILPVLGNETALLFKGDLGGYKTFCYREEDFSNILLGKKRLNTSRLRSPYLFLGGSGGSLKIFITNREVWAGNRYISTLFD